MVELEFVMRIVACIEQGDAEWAETYGWVGERFDRKTRRKGRGKMPEGKGRNRHTTYNIIFARATRDILIVRQQMPLCRRPREIDERVRISR